MLVDTSAREPADNRLGLAGFRARRTPTVASGSRARSYTTALAQADELWAASKATTCLASPILKYYAAMQAGLAVCAASARRNAEWQPKQGHGLKFSLQSGHGPLSLSDVHVLSESDGMAAQTLADAVGSPLLSVPASLAELIAALPKQRLISASQAIFPVPMHVEFDGYLEEGRVNAYFSLPESLVLAADGTARNPGKIELREHFSHYPSLVGLPDWEVVRGQAFRGSTGVRLFWTPSALSGWDWHTSYDISSSLNPNDGEVLPSVGGNQRTQHPFLTWYLVLYGFSMLARYHGERWRATLDYDSSSIAVPLVGLIEEDSEDCLRLACDVLDGFLVRAASKAN